MTLGYAKISYIQHYKQFMEEKVDKLGLIKILSVCFPKDTVRKMKR